MTDKLLLIVVIVFSSVVTVVFDYLHLPHEIINNVLIFLVLVVILLLNGLYVAALKEFFTNYGKLILLFLSSLLVQLFIINLGGVRSPFFILLHLSIVGASFIVSAETIWTFFAASFVVLLLHVYISPLIRAEFINDPPTFFFILASYVVTVPMAQILAGMYRGKESVTKVLREQVSLDETILQDVREVVFVTDTSFNIISANEAAEQILHRSKSEIVKRLLFSVIFLKDSQGGVLVGNSIPLDTLLKEKKTVDLPELLLLPVTGVRSRKVHIRITPVIGIEGKVNQLCFLISDVSQLHLEQGGVHQNLEEAHTKYEAQLEDLKQRLLQAGLRDLHARLVLTSHTEEDILAVRTLEDHGIQEKRVLFDLATLVKQIITAEKEYTEAFSVPLTFSFAHFGQEDIAPYIAAGTYRQIKPEDLTGPFFTIQGDIKYIGVIFQKLLTMSVLLSSSSAHPAVQIMLSREKNEELSLSVVTTTVPLTAEEEQLLFRPYYPALATKTNLHFGSGLEGYLLKMIIDFLNLPFRATYNPQTAQLTFTLLFRRYSSTLS